MSFTPSGLAHLRKEQGVAGVGAGAWVDAQRETGLEWQVGAEEAEGEERGLGKKPQLGSPRSACLTNGYTDLALPAGPPPF